MAPMYRYAVLQGGFREKFMECCSLDTNHAEAIIVSEATSDFIIEEDFVACYRVGYHAINMVTGKVRD